MPSRESDLPDKLSSLIRLALKDMTRAKKARIGEDMSSWIAVNNRNRCVVCMAGAVMVGTLKMGREFGVPSMCKAANAQKLWAINYARTGSLGLALREMSLLGDREVLRKAQAVICSAYDDTKQRATFAAYRKAAKMLAEAGL